MALINCHECNNIVSDKAEKCPHCGVSFQTQSNPVQNSREVIDSGNLLFSTKSAYDSNFMIKNMIFSGLPAGFAVLGFLISWVFLIFFVVGFIASFFVSPKLASMKNSYVELYENNVSGVTSIIEKGAKKGTSFVVSYRDITHIDELGNEELIIHTAHTNYRVQAFRCTDKVRKLIQEQKEKY